jgi:short-chain fatty acids transporter
MSLPMKELQTNQQPRTNIFGRLISSLSDVFSLITQKYMPNPLIFAIFFTLLAGGLGIVFGKKTPIQMIDYWGSGFWNLHILAMQMALGLVAGYSLAQAPILQRLLEWLASRVHTAKGAIFLATFIACIASYLNSFVGLILGVIIAQKLAQRIPNLHYPLIVAAAYTGFTFYGLGLSGTIPLLISTKGHFLEKSMGIIPLSQTMFSPMIIILTIILLITLPIINSMIKARGKIIKYEPVSVQETNIEQKIAATPAEKLERSKIIAILIGVLGISFVLYYFIGKNGKLDLNSINFLFLFLGLTLHGSVERYIGAVNEAVKGVGGILLQYPFYAGIMGMMAGSGIVDMISHGFIAFSTTATLPFWGFICSMVLNFFTPSAGGHWVIQGPFMIEAAKAMGADLGKVSMSVQLGNSWQDIIQPFWILPTLAISGLGIRDIMGYNVIAFLWTGLVLGIGILIWGLI